MRQSDVMPNRPSPEDLLTATQVGNMIERSGRTILRAAEAGEIPVAAKLPGPNGAHLFKRADAEKFAAEFAAKASA